MAGSYNRIVIVGNLTRDPEIRYLEGGGKAVTKCAVAVNRKSKQGDETTFFDVVSWDRLAEIVNQYCKKGMSVLFEGRLAIRKYDDRDGNKRTAVEIVANDMQMLENKRNGESNGGSREYAGASARPSYGGGGNAPDDEFDDSEIPF
jgi:single-strand DNA-binding protein